MKALAALVISGLLGAGCDIFDTCIRHPVPLGDGAVPPKSASIAMPMPIGRALLPRPGSVVPRNVAPLLSDTEPTKLVLRGPTGPVPAQLRPAPGPFAMVRMVPSAPLPDGAYRVEAPPPAFDSQTDMQILVSFTVGEPEDLTPPGPPAITSAEFEDLDGCGSTFDLRGNAAIDVGSPPDGLVHELFVSESPEHFDEAPVDIAAPGMALRWTLFSAPSGQPLAVGSVLYAKIRARDLADNAGAFSETWRLVGRE